MNILYQAATMTTKTTQCSSATASTDFDHRSTHTPLFTLLRLKPSQKYGASPKHGVT